MDRPYIKLYGERHTGTKYLNLLLVINVRAIIIPGTEDLRRWYFWKAVENSWRYELATEFYFKTNFSKTLGWKHILLPSLDVYRKTRLCSQNILFLTLTKNPYSWLLSLYNNPKHAQVKYTSFEQFLTTPWNTRRRENAPEYFSNPMELWNMKNSAYLRLKTGPWTTFNIRYEDLVADPEGWIDRIAASKNMERKLESFENRENATTRYGHEAEKNFSYYRDYYLGERWREKLTSRQIEMINPHLDEGLMEQFGYPRINP